ncbi:hypothetical protein PHYSODRAFT_322031 [Phytophthora sojae]|uniref:Uncharacterized protein n=1 Tax=Phytophthora sojae (strain P6497) TaxID=1094619 RepID=G4YG15_PHYSP|nr:hypothetical protein PHYSODRAFT_322031 [Phytophthora sojae]EGZ28358.1 hypothetical protein PHYSODRAFT_322031 [Phytophthora sojae]|eukprot:XP_009515633.1 hypothetical protein PHYSODRAFT_322031 [Phytophthora sojae]
MEVHSSTTTMPRLMKRLREQRWLQCVQHQLPGLRNNVDELSKCEYEAATGQRHGGYGDGGRHKTAFGLDQGSTIMSCSGAVQEVSTAAGGKTEPIALEALKHEQYRPFDSGISIFFLRKIPDAIVDETKADVCRNAKQEDATVLRNSMDDAVRGALCTNKFVRERCALSLRMNPQRQ